MTHTRGPATPPGQAGFALIEVVVSAMIAVMITGGVIALLMWFYLSSIFVVLGAEINAEMERQTVKDTTGGTPEPMGKRGAYAADTVGPEANESSSEQDEERRIEGR